MVLEKIKALVQEDFNAVSSLITKNLETETGLAHTMSQHLMNGGGKRIRPLLVLLSSHACAYAGSSHITAAALIECFHAGTLLHDDVIDESTLRRGVETANSIWGSKASILVGDFLLTLAIKMLLNIPNAKIQHMISKTGYEITRGELKQHTNRNNINLTTEEYFEIIRSKTALLFAASTCMGPLLQDQHHPLEDAFYNYGIHLGNAFQIIDDTLDYCSDAATIGKNVGDDLADGKLTLPILHVLKHGNEIQKQLIIHSFENNSHQYFPDILNAIEATGAVEYTRAIANREKDLAIACLNDVPDSPYKTALIDLAIFALERSY